MKHRFAHDCARTCPEELRRSRTCRLWYGVDSSKARVSGQVVNLAKTLDPPAVWGPVLLWHEPNYSRLRCKHSACESRSCARITSQNVKKRSVEARATGSRRARSGTTATTQPCCHGTVKQCTCPKCLSDVHCVTLSAIMELPKESDLQRLRSHGTALMIGDIRDVKPKRPMQSKDTGQYFVTLSIHTHNGATKQRR